jgi:hypothetical protein
MRRDGRARQYRDDSDAAHQWLRSVVTEVVSMRLGLTAPPP